MNRMLYLLLCIGIHIATLPCQQIVTLFVHGIHDSYKRQGIARANTNDDTPYLINSTIFPFEFEDSIAYHRYHLNFPWGSLAQDDEIEQLSRAWQHMNEQYPYADGFILMGVSRGASAIINFLAHYKPEKVKAAILESPYDTIENIVHHRAKRLGVAPCMVHYAINALFWKFDHNGIMPAHMIEHIKDDIPMLFISLHDDHSVAEHSSRALYEQRINQNFKHVHYLSLLHGRHGKLIHGPDGSFYQDVVHAFNKAYHLPHNELCAQRGWYHFCQL